MAILLSAISSLAIVAVAILFAIAADSVILEFQRRMIDENVRIRSAIDALESQKSIIDEVLSDERFPNSLKRFLLLMSQLIERRRYAHHLADCIEGEDAARMVDGVAAEHSKRADKTKQVREFYEGLDELKEKDEDAYRLYLSAIRHVMATTLLQWPETMKHFLQYFARVETAQSMSDCAVLAEKIIRDDPIRSRPPRAAPVYEVI